MGRSARCAIPRLSSVCITSSRASAELDAVVQRPERHILLHGRAEQLIVGVLQHDADLAVQPLQAGLRIIHGLSKHDQLALMRPQRAVQQEHERRFADAVGAQQSDLAAEISSAKFIPRMAHLPGP